MAEALTVEPRTGFALIGVMARRSATVAAIGEALGIVIDSGPRLSGAGAMMLIGTGPGTWLALAEMSAPALLARLRDDLGPLASLSDQSGAYVIHRLSGPAARTLLQRGAAIDLHPSAFAPGCVATTVIAHIGVIIWQVDDRPTYDVAVFRSYAESFGHWLDRAVAAL